MPSTIYESALTTVEWPYEDHLPAVLCPVTGMVVTLGFSPEQDPDEEPPKEPADAACPTLLFRFLYEGGLDYIHPELADKIQDRRQALIDEGHDEAEDFDDFEVISEHLEDLGLAPLIIDMPTQGLAGDGVVVGLDLARAFPNH